VWTVSGGERSGGGRYCEPAAVRSTEGPCFTLLEFPQTSRH
jgi:hypothetical protein